MQHPGGDFEILSMEEWARRCAAGVQYSGWLISLLQPTTGGEDMCDCMSSNQLVNIVGVGWQGNWTKTITAVSPKYFEAHLIQLGIKAKEWVNILAGIECQVRETQTAYQELFEREKDDLILENTFFWNRSPHPIMT